MLNRMDRPFTIILFLLGLGICWASLDLGYGGLVKPGPGFLSFWCGLLMAAISFGLVVAGPSAGKKTAPESSSATTRWKPAVTLTALITYGFFMNTVGFTLLNLLFVIFLLQFVWRKKPGFVLTAGLLIAAAFFLIFESLMKIRLPEGFLGRLLGSV